MTRHKELTKFNFTSWQTGAYKIQFHKLAYWSSQNSISQAGKQELTKFNFTSWHTDAYKIQFHKLANRSLRRFLLQIQTVTSLQAHGQTFKGHRKRIAVPQED
jgi:homoserine trans-succinylase